MKYLKLYESEKDESEKDLIEFFDLKYKYYDLKYKIEKNVEEFLDCNFEKFKEKYDYNGRENIEEIRENDDTISIVFELNVIWLDKEDFKDLLVYLKDPELYKETKKYNL